MAELVTRWRRWANLAPKEPTVPYDDDDEAPDDREKAVAEVLGRLIRALGALDVRSCKTSADVDKCVAEYVHMEVTRDTRPGAMEAARIVLSLLRVPATLPEPDSPSLGEPAG